VVQQPGPTSLRNRRRLIISCVHRGREGSVACQCTTPVYSLFSACGACQGAFWIRWSQWSS
ncbi:hypothetical protein BC827DRAFT_1249087, partial [Russula dissimulans]